MPYFVHNSNRLFYREKGNGSLVILLPGNTASSACYEGEIEYFSRHYHTAALDFCGTGQSDRIEVWPDDWWHRGAYDVAALIKHIGEKKAILLGSSGGGIIALLAAILVPERVRAVVADSCIEIYPAKMLQHLVASRKEHSSRQIAFWRMAHGDDWEQVVSADSDRLLRAMQHDKIDWAQDRLKEIACPVLLTGSLQDHALPDIGRQMFDMAEQIPKSRLFLVNEGKHPMMWSRRNDFFHVCDYFLKTF